MVLNKIKYRVVLIAFFLLFFLLSLSSCRKDAITIPIGDEENETIPVNLESEEITADHPLFTMQMVNGSWMITGLTDEGADALELTIPASWNEIPVTRVGYLMSSHLRTLRTEEGAILSFDQRSIVSMPELTELVFIGSQITVGDFCFTDCPKLLAIQTGENSVVSFGDAVMNGNKDPLYILFLDGSSVTVGSQSFLKTGSLSFGKKTTATVGSNSFSECETLYLSEEAALCADDYTFSMTDGISLEKGASVEAGDYSFASVESLDLMEEAGFVMGNYCLSRSKNGSRISLGPATTLQSGNSCLGNVVSLSLDEGATLELGSKSLHASGNTAMVTAEADSSMTLGDESINNFKMITLNGNAKIQAGSKCFVGYSAALSLTMGNLTQLQAGDGCLQNVGLLSLGEGCQLKAGDYAFAYSDSLPSVTLPRGVSLGEYAFAHSKKITSVRLLDGYTDIASHSYFGCTALARAEIPVSVTHIGGSAFENTSENLVIHGKSGSVAAYYASEKQISFRAQ